MRVFGPVPSRRLGRSLGINNIPPKVCTFACAYCQLGRTIKMQVARSPFYGPEALYAEARDKLHRAQEAGDRVDYISFVPDGEPTLDANLGEEIALLRLLGIPIAVISNASLIWRQDVQRDLLLADWVSLKVDAVRDEAWRKIDRPHGSLQLDAILNGALAFARAYRGKLVSETMLVAGVNDGEDDVKPVAEFLRLLHPATAYISVATRPPVEEWVHTPNEAALNRAYQLFRQQVPEVRYLIGYEGNAFAQTGQVEEDLLSITSVHPMREDAVNEFLANTGYSWQAVRKLMAEGKLVETAYEGHRFYVRK